jgi:hypothetical protein
MSCEKALCDLSLSKTPKGAILPQITRKWGMWVKVTLEIEARIEARTLENVVRTVTENSRTLKFTTHGFEEE